MIAQECLPKTDHVIFKMDRDAQTKWSITTQNKLKAGFLKAAFIGLKCYTGSES